MLNRQDCILFITLFLCVTSNHSYSQESHLSDSLYSNSETVRSYGIIKTTYNSDIVFLGRNSSGKIPYMNTSAGYYHKSGLFVNGTASYLTNSNESNFDLFSTTIGYDLNFEQYNIGFSGTKYFFNNKSTTVISELTGNINAYIDRDFGIVDITTTGTLYFSQNFDFIIDLSLTHDFYAMKGNLKISPSVSLNAGTQNYFGNYNNNIHFGGGMSPGGGSSSMGSGGMNKDGSGNGFKILDYEFTLPFNYTVKKFNFSIAPTYSIPINAATIANGQTIYTEQLSNHFFWSIAIRYKIF